MTMYTQVLETLLRLRQVHITQSAIRCFVVKLDAMIMALELCNYMFCLLMPLGNSAGLPGN